MKTVQHILVGVFIFLLPFTTFSQPKNVDKSVNTFHDGLQTLRVLEYPEPAPGNNKIYRLGTLAENGFPEIVLQSSVQAGITTFEDKFPYSNVFNDNPGPFTSEEGAQSLYSFQSVMKAFDVRFGWKGLDGTGTVPINIVMSDSQKYPASASAFYTTDGSNNWYFFIKDLNSAEPFYNVIETVAHEYLHGIMRYKRGSNNYNPNYCAESRSVDEGIADIFGVYIRNKIQQIPPQNFDWDYQKSQGPNVPMSNPKGFEFPDTYNGQYYKNECNPAFKPHFNAGVLFKWVYLLSEGFQGAAYNDLGYGYSNLTGIGVEKCIDILWAALPKTNKDLTYPSFKILTLETAKQLYGLNSVEYQAVEKAWCAVGVCDNNLPFFTIYPPNASSHIEPWPTVKVNFSWDNDPRVKKVVVQMASDYNFTNPQEYEVSSFDTFFKPGGGVFYKGSASGYFRPSETVYVRAKITEADPNFCKGLNPLCKVFQQFSPAHAFKLDDKKVAFWTTSTIMNPWHGELTWKSMKDAELYLMQVASDASFNSIIYEGFASHTGNFTETGLINATLEIGETYYARVAAKRKDKPILSGNYGLSSNILTIKTSVPSTAIIQAKTQKPNDPPLPVGSLGRLVSWDPVPGASSFVVEVAKDNAFSNIISSVTIGGNHTSTILLFPPLPNLTNLYVRALPKKNLAFGVCSDVLRIQIDETAALPVMKSPVNGTSFPFKNFAATNFEWKSGTLNMNTVDHFELHLTKPAGPTSIFTSQGKTLDLFVQDPLAFNATGLKARVLAVNPLGAKTALSQPFDYPICPDHPAVFFPGDLGKVDPTKDFKVEWFASESFIAGSQYLVTILDGAVPVPGFNDKPTTAHSMLVPVGTLTNGKSYTVTVKNSSSCPAILLPKTFFTAVGSGSVNQPQPPKLVNFTVELKGFRNDPDAFSIPPAYGTSNYELGIELFDPNGNPLSLLDPNLMPVTKLNVDSENSGVVMVGSNKPQGKYKLRLNLAKIFPPNTYYPLDQPRFSVLLNGQAVVLNHIITFDIFNPGSSFDEWKEGFQFADVILDVK